MAKAQGREEAGSDPDGSIFLYEPLSARDYDRLGLTLLLGRGVFKGLSFEEQDDMHRELTLRRHLTQFEEERAAAVTL